MEVPAPRTDTERQTEPVSTGRWRAFEAAIQRMGKDEYDLMLRLLSFLDEGRKDALRAQFADMMGFGRMSTLEQERKLAGSKAYQKALADATGSAEKDKRMLRDVFERFARVRAIEERMKLRQERLKRMRHAVETRLNQRIAEYEAKKRLYDQKFEDIENAAYAAAQDRLTDDRRRYEALAQELEKRLHEETLSIAQAQKAMEDANKEREQLERSMGDSRDSLRAAMEVLQLAQLRLHERPDETRRRVKPPPQAPGASE